MSEKTLVQIAKKNGKFVLINPTSIASIEQLETGGVRITLKEIKDGQSIFYDCHYDLKALIDPTVGILKGFIV